MRVVCSVCGAILSTFLGVLHAGVALVCHPLFRLFGRRGTVRYTSKTDGSLLHVGFDREAFKRATCSG